MEESANWCLYIGSTALLGIATTLFVLRKKIFSTLFEKLDRSNSVPPYSSAHGKLNLESQTRLMGLLNAHLTVSIIVRSCTGALEYVNPYTEVLTGYAISEFMASGSDILEQISQKDDRARYLRALEIAKCGEEFQLHHRIHHRSNVELWVESHLVPIFSQNGEVEKILSISVDATRMVRAQQQVEEKSRDLHDFTYMISHDLKSPIATIKGMLGVVSSSSAVMADGELKEPLEHISRAVSRLEALVASVLELAGVTSVAALKDPVDITKVIEQVISESKVSLGNGSVIFQEPSVLVLGDQLRLYQVFSNLVNNAIKYRDPKRNLELKITFNREVASRQLEVAVADNGLGIPEEKVAHIFRPFQRAHKELQIPGSGVGLACVQKLVDKMGGEISCTSSQGTGSVFKVRLQLSL